MSPKIYTIEVEKIAKVCHETNRAYCEVIGDTSQPAWEDAPEWQRESAIQGVEFHVQNRKATPADSHENWLLQKKKDGWTYGPKKDPEKKEHPCMVPYNILPLHQRIKDLLFISTVKALTLGGSAYPKPKGV